MSFTAVESFPRHSFGHSMVDTMARPLSGWIHEPAYGNGNTARHVGTPAYYPAADQVPVQVQVPSMRLPPPSSLVSGAPPPPPSGHESRTPATVPAATAAAAANNTSSSATTPTSAGPVASTTTNTASPPLPPHHPPPPSLHTNVKPAYLYQHDYQTPSPVLQASPPLPAPTSQPLHHIAALAQQKRNAAQDLARVSPTLSSTASDRSAEDYQDARASQGSFPQLPRIQQHQPPHHPQHHHYQQQLPHTQPQQVYSPTNHRKRLSTEDHYSEMHPSKYPPPPPNYPPNAHPQHQHQHQPPQPTSPQSRQVWSPRSEPKTDRVKISDLLTNEEPQRASANHTMSQPNSTAPHGTSTVPRAPMPSLPATPGITSEYRIHVRQQPVAARSCGFGERDRRVIDPPPIVQLTIDDPSLSADDVAQRLRWPYSVMHCSIWDATGQHDCSAMPEDYRQQRRLMGTLVASPFVGLDEHGEEGCFFCFPDLSCRTPGTFRLKFALVIIDPCAGPGARKKFPVQAQVLSDVFTVYNAKDFPGMQASTPLTKKLKEQGCLISIKKGNEKGGSNARDDSDEDGDEGSSGGRRRRKRSRKS